VAFPSNAKKAQLVALFEAHVRPRAAQTLRNRMAVEGSSKGIQRVSNKTKHSSDVDDLSDDLSSSEESVGEEVACS
jgi:hypothetical protein